MIDWRKGAIVFYTKTNGEPPIDAFSALFGCRADPTTISFARMTNVNLLDAVKHFPHIQNLKSLTDLYYSLL